jgi:V/A-type H+/Na+-transporting ATPase subunit G/H
MEDILKQLLDAEVQAEKLVAEAEAKYAQIMQQTRDETRAVETRYEALVPDLRAAHEAKAKDRAAQTIAELKRRYDERQREQHNLAEQRSNDALEAAVAILIDPARG